jgi:hypothetical protein
VSTDRELLELAAKAAGINAKWYDVTGCLMRTAAGSGLTRWEPLSNDGDALRLAVKLRLTIDIERDRKGISGPALAMLSLWSGVDPTKYVRINGESAEHLRGTR